MTAGSSTITSAICQPTWGQASQHIYGGLAGSASGLYTSNDHSLHAWAAWNNPEQWRDFHTPGMTRVYVAQVDSLLGKVNFASLLQFYMDSNIRQINLGKGSRSGMLTRAGRNVFLFSGNPAVLATMPSFNWAGEATNRAYKAYIDGHNAPIIAAEQERMRLMAEQMAIKQRYSQWESAKQAGLRTTDTVGVGTSTAGSTGTATTWGYTDTAHNLTYEAISRANASYQNGLASSEDRRVIADLGKKLLDEAKTEAERVGIIGKLKALITK